tara:strand:- start:2847 stop:2975 length:129 start_codon:yes stop_codon:yes gene_type:complete
MLKKVVVVADIWLVSKIFKQKIFEVMFKKSLFGVLSYSAKKY